MPSESSSSDKPALSLEAIVSRIRDESGADFAFVLTRKGRLLTRDAPPQMPEIGRAACVAAARVAEEARSTLVERTMPREHLVPYGGAAPVDVFVSPCGEAVVCVVLATWTDSGNVSSALDEHLPEFRELLEGAKAARAAKRTGGTVAPPPPGRPMPGSVRPEASAKPVMKEVRASSRPSRPPRAAPSSRSRSAPPRERPSSPPPSARPPSVRPRPLTGLVEMSKQGIRASRRMQSAPTITHRRSDAPPAEPAEDGESRKAIRPKPHRGPLSSEVPLGGRGSLPMIEVGEGSLGRESLAAIEADGHARGSLPMIEVGETLLGRESLAALDDEARAARAARAASSSPEIAVGFGGTLGRESLDALEDERLDEIPRGSPLTSAPDLEIEMQGDDDEDDDDDDPVLTVESSPRATQSSRPVIDSRSTQPWSGAADDPDRPAHAARLALQRPGSPPRPIVAPPGAATAPRKRKHNSNVELFRQALDDLLEPGAEPADEPDPDR